MISIPYHTYIIFLIGILVYTFTFFLIKGDIFKLYSGNDFPIAEYSIFWKNMTKEQRLFLTETYNSFYIYLRDTIDQIQSTNINKNIKIESKFLNSTYLSPNQQYENVPFVLVSIIPKNKNFTKKLLICAHFDVHNLTSGGTAYDDAIHVVSMLGTIHAITKNGDFNLDTQVDFLFDGAEEYGLVGAFQYIEYLKNNNITENYDYLNLESMGGSPPYLFVIKNDKGNFRIQKTLSKTTGSILLAMNFIYESGIVTSSTDHVVFNEQNWTGGVNVFLGKGSVYHTKYDKINEDKSYEHLKIAGNQLLNFVLNYKAENDGENGNSVGYGIAPICIVLPSLFFYITNPIIFVIAVIFIIIKERNSIKEFFWDLLKEFIIFIIIIGIFIIVGLLVCGINSNAASSSQIFVILTAIMGLFLFLIFHRIFKIKKWSRFRLIFNLLLLIILIDTDLSLFFLALTILSTIFYFFDNKIVKYIVATLQYFITSLFFAVIIQICMQYTTRLSEIFGNILIFMIYFIFSYNISISPLDLYEIPEDEKIIDLFKKFFNFFKKEEKERNSSLFFDNKYNINYIKDELIDERDSISSKSSKFIKYFNKNYIPLYLLFFYLLYFLILLLILFLKPYPYSSNYVLRGAFYNIYTSPNNSKMIFLPFNGYNYAKKNIKEKQITFSEDTIEKYLGHNDYSENKVFVVDSNEPITNNNKQCTLIITNVSDIFEISKISENSVDNDNLYDFQFKLHIDKEACIDSVYFYIRCDKCIKKVNAINRDEENYNGYLLIRVGKKEIDDSNLIDFYTEFNMTLSVKEFNYYLLLNTMKNTKDYLNFLNYFGDASCNARSTRISDTIFKFDSKFPK